MLPKTTEKTKKFTGLLSITDLNGTFISGFRVQEGALVSRFVKKKQLQRASLFSFLFEQSGECNETLDPTNEFCKSELEEVEITVKNKTNNVSTYYLFLNLDTDIDGNDGGGSSSGGEESWDFGGSGNQTNNTCPGIKIKDANGNCVCPAGYIEDSKGNCIIDPCSSIKIQINNTAAKAKMDFLKTKTSLRNETGYIQNKDGSFTALTTANNGHSLNTPIDRNTTMGYMHTHTDDYEDGLDENGDVKFQRPIKIFSPRDLIKFLQIVKATKYNGVSLASTYGTVVSSTGTYTLRFTGNIDDIKGFDTNRDIYIKYFNKKYKNNTEKAFLNYLKEKVNINGLRLFKVENNNTIKEKKLDNTGNNVTSDDCN